VQLGLQIIFHFIFLIDILFSNFAIIYRERCNKVNYDIEVLRRLYFCPRSSSNTKAWISLTASSTKT